MYGHDVPRCKRERKVNMKLCNKIKRILPLLFLVVLLIQVVLADTYYGSVDYDVDWNGDQMTGTIEFGVYDDRAEFESDFIGAGLVAPGDGDYVYAYRVTQSSVSGSPLSYFAILGLDEQNTSGFGALDDGFGGIEPSDYGFTDDDGYWQWGPGYGFIQENELSWLLVFSSEYDWKPGEYEIKGVGDEFPGPDDDGSEVPEPTMIALLGVGGAYLLRRKRKS